MKSKTWLPLFGVALYLALPVSTAWAEESEESSYFREHFQLNGYLTLGYGDLNLDDERPLTGNEAILGIPEDGTLPYGNAALLLRYTPSDPRHTFVLQLSGRELGESPASDLEDAIELDWLFYQFQIAEHTELRVGRLPAPVGIFNEIRDVGVLLPFYRPPYVFYREGSVFSETVDGLSLSHRFRAESDWSLETDLYYGEFDVFEQTIGIDEGVTEASADEAFGAQIWLNTPIDELRIGIGGLRWVVGAESRFNIEPTTWRSWYLSFDWVSERFVARAEYRALETSSQSSPAVPLVEADADYFYVQLGWKATDRLSFYIQPETADVRQSNDIFVGGSSGFREREDLGFSVVYALRPNVVFKGEYHEVRSELLTSSSFVLGPSGPKLQRDVEGFDSNYSILSISLSF